MLTEFPASSWGSRRLIVLSYRRTRWGGARLGGIVTVCSTITEA
jgi:hypothetical protein